MSQTMLIDARYREETRVAVTKDNRVEEFDYESCEHKQIKGNIYLAKIVRVEPSLQAAFVDYGGNRHGFLAFSEIHPDYYQIPKEDRGALLREEAAHISAAATRSRDELDLLDTSDEEEVDDSPEDADSADIEDSPDDSLDDSSSDSPLDSDDSDSAEDSELDQEDSDDSTDSTDSTDSDDRDDSADDSDSSKDSQDSQGKEGRGRGRRSRRRGRASKADSKGNELRHRYKIQDVIRRRQVILVQVVKEERGTKGATLTSYLSLAGRYCVLLPNSVNGNGVSRKIVNNSERRKLKAMIDNMQIPENMGCIGRTAGIGRARDDITRDFNYLARLWDSIREKTLQSEAPELIHSDSDLIKRAIRDIYHRDIAEVYVEGEEGYRTAKEYMKQLTPSHARRVKRYSEAVPLYQRYGIEKQLSNMLSPIAQLKSGGYLVINPTEALVSIDVNSGRSTREHTIDQTALQTNIEAAQEVARQLRLRDIAGLIIIDFIDMAQNSHNNKVERAFREALKSDRARIQIGRISGFGLLEMSRQRLRTSILEASTQECPHCSGRGIVRTVTSASLSVLRSIEQEIAHRYAEGKASSRSRNRYVTVHVGSDVAFYLLNHKRETLESLEKVHDISIAIVANSKAVGIDMEIQVSSAPVVFSENEGQGGSSEDSAPADVREGKGKRKRKRRGGGGGGGADSRSSEASAKQASDSPSDGDGAASPSKKSKRRGRKKKSGDVDSTAQDAQTQDTQDTQDTSQSAESPKKKRGRRRRAKGADASDASLESPSESKDSAGAESANESASESPPKKRRRRSAKTAAPSEQATSESSA